jgi:hypothetical protein
MRYCPAGPAERARNPQDYSKCALHDSLTVGHGMANAPIAGGLVCAGCLGQNAGIQTTFEPLMTDAATQALTPAQKRVVDLEFKLKQARNAVQKAAARQRAREVGVKRKIENRQKLLVGAFVLDQMHKSGLGVSLLTYDGATFNEWLKRDDERELFGLEPL